MSEDTKNILHAFNASLKLVKTTQASPRDAKISSYMRALTPKNAPNDEDEAINKPDPWSSRLLTSTSEKASILEMSSLKTVRSYFIKEPHVDIQGMEKGEIYILYPDRLIVLNKACKVSRKLDFRAKNVAAIRPKAPLEAAALVVNEQKGLLAAGYKDQFLIIFPKEAFEVQSAEYLFGEAQTEPYRLTASAMDWSFDKDITRFTMRLVLERERQHGRCVDHLL